MTMSGRWAIKAAAWWRMIILVACAIVVIVALDWYNTKNYRAPSVDKQASTAITTAAPMTAIAEMSLQDASQSEAPFAVIASVSTPDVVATDANEAESPEETVKSSLPDFSDAPTPEMQPVQIAAVNADDVVHGDFGGIVLPGSWHAKASEMPPDGKEAVDECLAREICIDEYLWSVYQRAPKQDTIKVVERKKVTVKVDGKTRTVVKESTTLVDEDFAWKDPKAAEKARMSLMEYVIGGVDRDFKLKLYHALRAMDGAGLSVNRSQAGSKPQLTGPTTGEAFAADMVTDLPLIWSA
jgi:hypothetical protein